MDSVFHIVSIRPLAEELLSGMTGNIFIPTRDDESSEDVLKEFIRQLVIVYRDIPRERLIGSNGDEFVREFFEDEATGNQA